MTKHRRDQLMGTDEVEDHLGVGGNERRRLIEAGLLEPPVETSTLYPGSYTLSWYLRADVERCKLLMRLPTKLEFRFRPVRRPGKEVMSAMGVESGDDLMCLGEVLFNTELSKDDLRRLSMPCAEHRIPAPYSRHGTASWWKRADVEGWMRERAERRYPRTPR